MGINAILKQLLNHETREFKSQYKCLYWIFCLQVRLIYKDDEENIPNYDDIFRDDDEDEDDEVSGYIIALLVAKAQTTSYCDVVACLKLNHKPNNKKILINPFSYYRLESSSGCQSNYFLPFHC